MIEGSHYSRICSDYTVTADNTLFQYKFAVVLQNTIGTGGGGANHEPFQKPGFNVLSHWTIRWGEVIFSEHDFNASDPAYGWKGTYKGIMSDVGLYPYKFKVEMKNGNILEYVGMVNLLNSR